MVKRRLYATAGRGEGHRLDPGTGRTALDSRRARREARRRSSSATFGARARLLVDGKEERILYVTPGYRLICLNAKTANRLLFRKDGIVDLNSMTIRKFFPIW